MVRNETKNRSAIQASSRLPNPEFGKFLPNLSPSSADPALGARKGKLFDKHLSLRASDQSKMLEASDFKK